MADIAKTSPSAVTLSGEKPGIVQAFSIVGLHGYRTISLESPYAATILIAKNGSGKTTLLAALDAFLKRQFSRLRDLHFDYITCRLHGCDDELILHYEDIHDLYDPSPTGELSRISKSLDVPTHQLYQFIFEEPGIQNEDYRELQDNKIFNTLLQRNDFSTAATFAQCHRLRNELHSHNVNLRFLTSQLDSILDGIEIVYLPTFRRVELPLVTEESDMHMRRRKRFRPKFTRASALYGGDIQFGLGDIREQLYDLNQRILTASNTGYRQISADIINELIDGTFDRNTFTENALPDKESLDLFFSRIREGGHRIGPYNEIKIPNIENLQLGNDADNTQKTLRYFLSKLHTVISATKDIESRVEDFITSCNWYLSGSDDSAQPRHAQINSHEKTDNKQLKLNRQNLKVHAESLPSGRKIPLDSLSSGEKQMVSLFAKLYLDEGPKIVLIDEPELSLSMHWQRRILADVVTSPQCEQVVAITHSPFVFDNDLEPFARSLHVQIDFSATPISYFEADDSD